MSSSPLVVVASIAGAALAVLAAFLAYVWIRYSGIIGRIFEEAPVFRPLRTEPEPGGEEVRFPTEDGLELAGTFYKARTPGRVGVIVFCHEFLGDRWSFRSFGGHLRDLGFDVFTFDFRNHGDSPEEPGYKPLQWVSDRETRDLRAALAFLRTRADRDAAGVGLFGISRGGSTGLCVAAEDPGVWGVVTDSAFPTLGTMLSYIYRWAEIYVTNPWFWKLMPTALFRFAAWSGRVRTERKLRRKFADVERAVSRLSPRPWLAIHGARDNYIPSRIARDFFSEAGDPKELWIVPKAKHNRCREVAPAEYRERIADFFRKYAPRRPTSESSLSPPPAEAETAAASVPG